jgi:AcrR family transcriptional regulator
MTPKQLNSQREEAILDAALEVLSEVGYDRMSMDEIAKRAHASKATIYRRWSGKADMVAALVHRQAGNYPPLPDTGTLRGDLLAGLTVLCRVVEAKHAVVAGLTRAIQTDPELAQLLRQHVVGPGFTEADGIFERARSRGELPARVDVRRLLDICEAMIWHRLLLTGAPLDDAFITTTVDDILLPLSRH